MGPTASGKTALAVAWAERLRASIISVDSALVYRGMDVGSAKPDARTLARAPHRLIDIREPHETYSAAEFARDALREMQVVHEQGGLPLLVGGTGLYFRALLDGLSPLPEADPAVRAAIEAQARIDSWPALHRELASVDPTAAARIHTSDIQRIQRALEVWRISGRSMTEWQAAHARSTFPFRMLKLVVAPEDRMLLHDRIAQRFDVMLEAGLIDEVTRLRSDRRLNPDLPSMRAVGYRQAWHYLDGVGDLAALRARGIAATRQLAKRQLTWLRSELDARWFDPQRQQREIERAVALFLGLPA
jgi:tRNA dimethylallyltransferase